MPLRGWLRAPTSWHGEGLLASVAGALHATSFAPEPLPTWALPWVQLCSMAVLACLIWRSANIRRAAGLGFAFGLSTFALGLYWLHISIHLHGGVAWLPAALAVLLLAAFASLYYAAATALAWRLSARAPQRGAHGLQATLIWASSWTLLEWLRGTLFTGFPWLNVAYAHTDSVFSGWASVAGAYGVAWFASFAAATLALLVWTCAHPATQAAPRRMATRFSPLFVALLAGASALSGMLWSRVAWVTDYGQTLHVRLVQGNVAQSEKFDPALLRQHLDHYRALAALPAENGNPYPDLIVLPETAIPVLQDRLPAAQWQQWHDIARQATLLVGVPVHTTADGRHVYTNSVVALDAATDIAALIRGSAARYDKSHLVPFGEFIPAGFAWFVNAMAIPLGNFDRGATRQALFTIAGQAIAANICYEDVFGEDIVQAVRASNLYGDNGANVLINFSNLAWFGNSWALRQHLQMARMRTMETRRPMLRATNTGMTAAISPHGEVYATLTAHQVGVLDVRVQGTQGLTPYVRFGNLPILIWLACTLLFCAKLRQNMRT